MQWFFIDNKTLVEDKTSFMIRLDAGTWREPKEITPQKTNLPISAQVRLIREGLEFAREALSVQYAC